MTDIPTAAKDLNPFYGKVIGFVDQNGNLVEESNNEDCYSLLINVGEEDDVSLNERVLVFALGPEMQDPESGQSLGHFEIVRGPGRVTSVQIKMAVVSSSNMKTVRHRRPQTATSILAGTQPEYYNVEEMAPFRSPRMGDLVRFI